MKKRVLFTLLVCLSGLLKAQYTTTNLITNLSNPVAFTFTPDGRILVTLKAGTIKIFNANGTAIGDFYNLTDSTYNNFERGLLGIEVDPDFATNHYVYAYYNHRYPNNSGGTASQQMRVVRFTEVNNVGTNPTVILALSPGTIAGNHVGGNLRFRPSEPNKLYVSIGEIAVPANAQLLTNPYGKFLRINKDGSIPTDNPFYDDGNPAVGNDDRIWSYGMRNSFDFCFSPVNDSLYSTENGANTWDELNIITRGKNYGWSPCEGFYQQGSTTNLCNNANYTAPIEDWPSPLPAVTGVVHYNGCIMPELTNHLIVGDNDNGRIYNIELGNAPAYTTVVSTTQILDLDGLTTLKQGADGYIYALNGGYAPAGKLYRIGPTNPPTPPVAQIIIGIVPNEGCANSPFTLLSSSGAGILSYDFTLTNGNNTYSVASSNPNADVTPLVAGVYDLQLIVNNGCQSDTDFVQGYLTVFDEPQFTLNVEDAVDGGALGSAWLSNATNVNAIQWYDDLLTPLSTNDTIFNLSPGTYYVDVTNGAQTAACSVRDTVVVDLLNSIGEKVVQPVKTYPNPATGRLFIDLKNVQQQTLSAQVYNAMGALVLSQGINGKTIAELNIEALPAGIYYLLVVGQTQRYAAKWVKQ